MLLKWVHIVQEVCSIIVFYNTCIIKIIGKKDSDADVTKVGTYSSRGVFYNCHY